MRTIVIVIDSVGIGELPDSGIYGDLGANTLGHIYESQNGINMPNMLKLGIGNIEGFLDGKIKIEKPIGNYGKMMEASLGKDTTTGHWEIAGLKTTVPFKTYPNGFPKEFMEEYEKRIGTKTLGNYPASGTEIIEELGPEHEKTGYPIVYTSADSVFQIAAHEEVVPLEELYEACRTARKILKGKTGVGRVIARPFVGKGNGNYTRTSNRHDFSLEPPKSTMLDNIIDAGKKVLAVGKIKDIFAGVGISEYVYTTGNEDGINKTLEYMDRDDASLIFTNLVDYDMLYGHRRDIDGYAKAVAYFDDRLPEIIEKMTDDDVLMITADHGCDPGYTKTTDHTREYVPFIMYGKNIEPKNLGTHATFADMGATVLDYLGVESTIEGSSVL